MIKLSSAAPVAAAVVGAFIATAVIGYFNYHTVLGAMAPIGWGGLVLAMAAQLVLMAPLGLAWFLVAPDMRARYLPTFIWGRLMREAASDVLPFSQLGGFVIATRAMSLGGVSAAQAVGSGVVDLTVEIVAQMIYTLLGVGLLVLRLGGASSHDHLIYSLLGGLVVVLCWSSGFVYAQRERPEAWPERLASADRINHSGQRPLPRRVQPSRRGRLWPAGLGFGPALATHVSCWIASGARHRAGSSG